MSRITVLPTAAVDRVCHEEQMNIWAHDIAVALGMGDHLKISSYDEMIDIEKIIRHELRNIMESAFNHPEAVTMAQI